MGTDLAGIGRSEGSRPGAVYFLSGVIRGAVRTCCFILRKHVRLTAVHTEPFGRVRSTRSRVGGGDSVAQG